MGACDMTIDGATLHLLCGHIAAGKSTLATHLGSLPRTIVLNQDQWLARLFGDQINRFGYLACAERLHRVWEPHVIALLLAGLSVVLDMPANSPAARQWMRRIIEKTRVKHQLHFLDVPPEVCKARLKVRNANRTHQFRTSEKTFDVLAKLFVPPGPDEGFNVIVHRHRAALVRDSAMQKPSIAIPSSRAE